MVAGNESVALTSEDQCRKTPSSGLFFGDFGFLSHSRLPQGPHFYVEVECFGILHPSENRWPWTSVDRSSVGKTRAYLKVSLAKAGRRRIIGIFASTVMARRTHGGVLLDTVDSTGRESPDYARCDVDEKQPMIPSRIIGQTNAASQALQCWKETFSLRAGRSTIH
jgi:hypothetical protein